MTAYRFFSVKKWSSGNCYLILKTGYQVTANDVTRFDKQ